MAKSPRQQGYVPNTPTNDGPIDLVGGNELPPEFYQYGNDEFIRAFGREPGGDGDYQIIQEIINGANADDLAAQYNDGSQLGDTLDDGTHSGAPSTKGAYPQDVAAAKGDRITGPRQQMTGKPKVRIDPNLDEDSYPPTNSVDYSDDIDAEPRMDELGVNGSGGSMEDLMRAMSTDYAGLISPPPQGQGTMEDLIAEMSRQVPASEGMAPAANFDQRMGRGSIGPSPTQMNRLADPRMMGRPQSIQQPGVDLSQIPPGGGVVGGTNMPQGPDMIQQLLQTILGGGQ